MQSPFPGMDPYLEGPYWLDFQLTLLGVVDQTLEKSLSPRYTANIERRTYVERWLGEDDGREWAEEVLPGWWQDVEGRPPSQPGQPVECLLPMPKERKEPYLIIHAAETMEAVTIVELLSPSNKRTTSDGRAQYLAKREEILRSRTNLVELDLLRGGQRLPARGMPAGDYYALVSRGHKRPRTDVYAWSIREPLPEIPIPLKKDEPEVHLNLQEVFQTVYQRARYQLSVDYRAPLDTPLPEAEAAWVRSLLANH